MKNLIALELTSEQRMTVPTLRVIGGTTLAAIFVFLLLALGIGQGAAMQRSLAIAIVSGLMIQFPLVLIVLPALLCWSARLLPKPESQAVTD